MKTLAMLLVAASALTAEGIRWEKDLDAAEEVASSDGRLILCFVLLGNLDAEDC